MIVIMRPKKIPATRWNKVYEIECIQKDDPEKLFKSLLFFYANEEKILLVERCNLTLAR